MAAGVASTTAASPTTVTVSVTARSESVTSNRTRRPTSRRIAAPLVRSEPVERSREVVFGNLQQRKMVVALVVGGRCRHDVRSGIADVDDATRQHAALGVTNVTVDGRVGSVALGERGRGTGGHEQNG